MQALAQEASISQMCQYLKVSRAAYYKWLNRKPSRREIEDQAIVSYVKDLEDANDYIFGVKRLAMYVNMETSHHVSLNKMRRIMHDYQIVASVRTAKHDRKAEQKQAIFDNKLLTNQGKHKFHPDRPNEVWVTDCSEIQYGIKGTGRLRISAIKDLYDHSVIAWQVESTETAQLVTTTFEAALTTTKGRKPQILHSDQGSSYTSGLYNLALAKNGVTHSMSRAGTPGDNSPMESLWSHMKSDFFNFHRPLSSDEAITLVSKFMGWYNQERRQETLKDMTPEEYRNHAFQEVA
uniref:IS3 family transposase n=1 Tax=Levilactobacillus enshiensis TaxID=2590213 RepID=UPI0021F09917|nr:IS3 family transposase [Levilactobacillus enshiensis]